MKTNLFFLIGFFISTIFIGNTVLADKYELEIYHCEKNRIVLIDKNNKVVPLNNYNEGRYSFISNSSINTFKEKENCPVGCCFEATLINITNNEYRYFKRDCGFWDYGLMTLVESCVDGKDLSCGFLSQIYTQEEISSFENIGGCRRCSQRDILESLKRTKYYKPYIEYLQKNGEKIPIKHNFPILHIENNHMFKELKSNKKPIDENLEFPPSNNKPHNNEKFQKYPGMNELNGIEPQKDNPKHY